MVEHMTAQLLPYFRRLGRRGEVPYTYMIVRKDALDVVRTQLGIGETKFFVDNSHLVRFGNVVYVPQLAQMKCQCCYNLNHLGEIHDRPQPRPSNCFNLGTGLFMTIDPDTTITNSLLCHCTKFSPEALRENETREEARMLFVIQYPMSSLGF
jgi:hypothetical protein